MAARKVLLLGEIGVGKTSLAQRLLFDHFDTNYKSTIGVDLYKYDIEIPGEAESPVSLVLWDTDGNWGESLFRHVYVKGASAALIVGDAARRATQETMLALAAGFDDAQPGRPITLVPNKIDLPPETGEVDMPAALRETPFPFFKTSAKSGTNVHDAFVGTTRAILRRGL